MGRVYPLDSQRRQTPYKAVNPVTWIEQKNYRELEFHPSFLAYAAQRTELMAVLNSLAPEDWPRAALVTGRENPASGPCTPMPSGW